MAQNRIQTGTTMTYANGSGVLIASGSPVMVGEMVGVALVDIPDGESGELSAEGVYLLPKANEALAQGTTVYLDLDGDPVGGVAGSGALTATVADVVAGIVWDVAAEGDATVAVKINV